jgi:hypothetical protein
MASEMCLNITPKSSPADIASCLEKANDIIKAAREGISCPEGSLALSYDVRGNQYKVPEICFCWPKNMKEDRKIEAPMENAAPSGDTAVIPVRAPTEEGSAAGAGPAATGNRKHRNLVEPPPYEGKVMTRDEVLSAREEFWQTKVPTVLVGNMTVEVCQVHICSKGCSATGHCREDTRGILKNDHYVRLAVEGAVVKTDTSFKQGEWEVTDTRHLSAKKGETKTKTVKKPRWNFSVNSCRASLDVTVMSVGGTGRLTTSVADQECMSLQLPLAQLQDLQNFAKYANSANLDLFEGGHRSSEFFGKKTSEMYGGAEKAKLLAKGCPSTEKGRARWNIKGQNILKSQRAIADTVKGGYLSWFRGPDGESPEEGYYWHMLYCPAGKVAGAIKLKTYYEEKVRNVLNEKELIHHNIAPQDTELGIEKLADNFKRIANCLDVLGILLSAYKGVFLFRDPSFSATVYVALNVMLLFGNAEHMILVPLTLLIIYLLSKLKVRYYGEHVPNMLAPVASNRKIGRVCVAVLRAEDLVPMDPNHLADPFVEVRYVTDTGEVHRIGQSLMIQKTLNPEFQRHMHRQSKESTTTTGQSETQAAKGFSFFKWGSSSAVFSNSKLLQNQTVQWVHSDTAHAEDACPDGKLDQNSDADEALLYPILQEIDIFNKGPSPRPWKDMQGVIELDMYDADLFGLAEFMGRATIPLRDLVCPDTDTGSGETTLKLDLKFKHDGGRERDSPEEKTLRSNRIKQQQATAVQTIVMQKLNHAGSSLQASLRYRGRGEKEREGTENELTLLREMNGKKGERRSER